MKKIILGMILAIGPATVFAEECHWFYTSSDPGCMEPLQKERFYVGAGFAELVNPNGLALVPEERGYLSDPTFWHSSNVQENRRVTKTVALGYQMNKTFAIELGYLRGDKGATSTTTASGIGGSEKGNFLYPVRITQKETLSTWHISVVGQKPLNGFVSVIGRIGFLHAHTEWEERVRYDVPSNYGGNGMTQLWERSSDKESLLLGIGVNARIANNTDLRVEILKSDALSAPVPEVSLIVHF